MHAGEGVRALTPLFQLSHLIGSRHHAKGNAQAVPAVDRYHGKRQIGQFLFAEVLACRLVHFVRHMAIRDIRNCFRPGQRGPFAVGVVGRFAPCVERVHALLAFALRLQILPVHVETKGAAVYLRDPKLDHVKQLLFQTAVVEVHFQAQHGLVAPG